MTLAFRPVDPIEDVLGRLSHYRRIAFGVRTDFVATLYGAGSAIRREVLVDRAHVSSETLRIDLPSIRQALGDGAIPRAPDGMYELTRLGRAACDEAVAAVGIDRLRELLRAAA